MTFTVCGLTPSCWKNCVHMPCFRNDQNDGWHTISCTAICISFPNGTLLFFFSGSYNVSNEKASIKTVSWHIVSYV